MAAKAARRVSLHNNANVETLNMHVKQTESCTFDHIH